MADSEFQRPTLAENISMLRNDLFAGLDVSDTLRRMDEDVRAKVYAAALHTVYGYIDYLAMNMLPDLCDESRLARHAAMKRCPRKGATAASGYMRWEGVSDGLKVTAGSVIQRDDWFSTQQLPMQPAPVVSCACRSPAQVQARSVTLTTVRH